MTRFIQNSVVSCTVHAKKKKEKDLNGAVLNGIVGLLLPLDARSRGRRRFFFLCFHRHFSLKTTPTNPTCPKQLSTCWRGSSTMAALTMSLRCFCLKGQRRREEGQWEREEKRRERAEHKREGVEDRKKKENEKQRREREEKKQSRCHHRKPPVPPPAPLHVASSSSANDSSHRRSARLPFFFLRLHPCYASTIHVACEQWRGLFTQAGLSPALAFGPGSAQPTELGRIRPN